MANGARMVTFRWSCNADHDHTLDVADCDAAMQAIIIEMLEIVHDVPGRIEVTPFEVSDIPNAEEIVDDLASYADDEGEDALEPTQRARLIRLRDVAQRAQAKPLLN